MDLSEVSVEELKQELSGRRLDELEDIFYKNMTIDGLHFNKDDVLRFKNDVFRYFMESSFGTDIWQYIYFNYDDSENLLEQLIGEKNLDEVDYIGGETAY
jgi:hypothetical protein